LPGFPTPAAIIAAVPIYEYKCENGHVFEAVQKMTDDPVVSCHECGAPVERIFHPVAVHFKGSGFYTTDYGAKAKAGEDGKDAEKPAQKKEASKTGDKTEAGSS
jgi:putative FmdB family regulatory protein